MLFVGRQRRRFFAFLWRFAAHRIVDVHDLIDPILCFFIGRIVFEHAAIVTESRGVLPCAGQRVGTVEIGLGGCLFRLFVVWIFAQANLGRCDRGVEFFGVDRVAAQ